MLKIKVAVRAANFAKPDIAFDLAVDQINLDRYLPPQSQEKSATGAAAADGDSPSPQKAPTRPPSTGSGTSYDPLRRLVIAGQLQAGKLTAKNLKIQNLQLKLSGNNGVINLDPLNMNLYQGNIAGKGHFNFQQKEPSSDINFVINNVQIGSLLKDAANQDVIEGVTQARISLIMTGDTAEHIRKTLNGQGDEKARSGVLVPIIVSGTFASPKFRPDIKRIITQQIDKGILESEPAKKILEKDEGKNSRNPQNKY